VQVGKDGKHGLVRKQVWPAHLFRWCLLRRLHAHVVIHPRQILPRNSELKAKKQVRCRRPEGPVARQFCAQVCTRTRTTYKFASWKFRMSTKNFGAFLCATRRGLSSSWPQYDSHPRGQQRILNSSGEEPFFLWEDGGRRFVATFRYALH
jgi:hypothetical protein